MLTKYVSDEQWKKEAVYEVGDVVYNTITVSGDKGVYSAGSKLVEKFSTEELVAYQFRSAEKSVKDTLRYFAIEHIVQEIILEKASKRG